MRDLARPGRPASARTQQVVAALPAPPGGGRAERPAEALVREGKGGPPAPRPAEPVGGGPGQGGSTWGGDSRRGGRGDGSSDRASSQRDARQGGRPPDRARSEGGGSGASRTVVRVPALPMVRGAMVPVLLARCAPLRCSPLRRPATGAPRADGPRSDGSRERLRAGPRGRPSCRWFARRPRSHRRPPPGPGLTGARLARQRPRRFEFSRSGWASGRRWRCWRLVALGWVSDGPRTDAPRAAGSYDRAGRGATASGGRGPTGAGCSFRRPSTRGRPTDGPPPRRCLPRRRRARFPRRQPHAWSPRVARAAGGATTGKRGRPSGSVPTRSAGRQDPRSPRTSPVRSWIAITSAVRCRA